MSIVFPERNKLTTILDFEALLASELPGEISPDCELHTSVETSISKESEFGSLLVCHPLAAKSWINIFPTIYHQ